MEIGSITTTIGRRTIVMKLWWSYTSLAGVIRSFATQYRTSFILSFFSYHTYYYLYRVQYNHLSLSLAISLGSG